MPETLDYSGPPPLRPTPHPVMFIVMSIAVFVFGVVMLIYAIRSFVSPPPPATNPLAKINQYFSQTQAVISNSQLTDNQQGPTTPADHIRRKGDRLVTIQAGSTSF